MGVCERTFRRYLDRFEDAGIEGLIDRRLEQASHRRAPVDEVMALTEGYRRCHIGWSAKPFMPGIGATGDQLALVFESPAGSVLANRLVGLAPEGAPFDFAVNLFNDAKFTGACFSPDGKILFVNIFEMERLTPG